MPTPERRSEFHGERSTRGGTGAWIRRWRELVIAASIVASGAVLAGSPALADAPVPDGLDLGDQGAYVTFGDPAKLDLSQFTFEAWFRRDGAGVGGTTGDGGVADFIPLVGYGAPPVEAGADANWLLLGIDNTTDLLTADFEDGVFGSNSGLNHPVQGTTPITSGVWHHTAATFDGAVWRLYLDGNLEVTEAVDDSLLVDPAQQLALGAMLSVDGSPASTARFDGAFDEVRIWETALPQSTIQANINRPLPSSVGLIAPGVSTTPRA